MTLYRRLLGKIPNPRLRELVEKALNTFWQVFGAVYGISGLDAILTGHWEQALSLGRLAATAALGAVLALLRGAIVGYFNKRSGALTVSATSSAPVTVEEVRPLAEAIVGQAEPGMTISASGTATFGGVLTGSVRDDDVAAIETRLSSVEAQLAAQRLVQAQTPAQTSRARRAAREGTAKMATRKATAKRTPRKVTRKRAAKR